MIKKIHANKYALKTADGSRTLGTHPSKAKAMAQERAIKASEGRAAKGKKKG